MKFLIDVNVGKAVITYLNENKYGTLAVQDINPRMSDAEIIKLAFLENRIIVTMDRDFGELVYHSNEKHHGILLMRMENAKSMEKVKVMDKILKDHSDDIIGKFCVYQNGKLRIR